MNEDKWLLCDHCITAIRSRGERLFVGPIAFNTDDVEYGEPEQKCSFCGEVDDLYKCLGG